MAQKNSFNSRLTSYWKPIADHCQVSVQIKLTTCRGDRVGWQTFHSAVFFWHNLFYILTSNKWKVKVSTINKCFNKHRHFMFHVVHLCQTAPSRGWLDNVEILNLQKPEIRNPEIINNKYLPILRTKQHF